MAASNFSSPQFAASPAKRVQDPVDNVPAQQNGLKGMLTGLAQLGMGIATGDPALMASGASTAVLGPKAGKLAGTLANAAGGGGSPSTTTPPTQPVASGGQSAWNQAAPAPQANPVDIPNNPANNQQAPGVADATTAAGSAAQAASNKAASITGSGTLGANSTASTSGGASSAPANAQANAGGLDPLAYVALLQALGKSSPNPNPQNPAAQQRTA